MNGLRGGQRLKRRLAPLASHENRVLDRTTCGLVLCGVYEALLLLKQYLYSPSFSGFSQPERESVNHVSVLFYPKWCQRLCMLVGYLLDLA